MSIDPWELLAELREHFGSCGGIPDHLWDITDAALAEHDNPAELGWRNCGDFLFQADISETVCAQTVKVKDGWRWEVWRDRYETEGFSTTLEEAKQKAIQVGRTLK
jgi:hypothetical protein